MDLIDKKYFESKYGEEILLGGLTILMPVEGIVKPLSETDDPAFTEGMYGSGCGIDPTGTEVFAPLDGKVTWISEEQDRIQIESRGGVRMMIHSHPQVAASEFHLVLSVKEGDEILRGDRLFTFDPEKIREAGMNPGIALIVINIIDVGEPNLLVEGEADLFSPIMTLDPDFKPAEKINSLRAALAFLRQQEGQLIETNTEVDPHAEVSGVYRYVGAGGTVKRPTKRNGPAMLFHNVKGHPDASVLIGLLASRERVASLLGYDKDQLGDMMWKCVADPIPPVISRANAPSQEVVHLATDPDFDLFKLVPAPTNTPVDAGPYITMGMCYATHPDTGKSDVTIHRMCIQSKDELSIFLQPGSRHIGAMADRASELGIPLPISISIGVDPAIELGACFEPPTTPMGYNELGVAGAIRRAPVVMHKCLTIDEYAIANAEYVIEGEIVPNVFVQEDQNTHTGYAMPEFPGYNGEASGECRLIKVKAVTHHRNPIMQSVIGPSEEHVNLAGIPTEASILSMLQRALPGFVQNAYAHPSGGGKYMIILQCKKAVHTDEGKQRQAGLLAFASFSELKHVILVDDDVDIFDTDDVLWALNTRFQGDRDIITIPGVRCHPLDPSASHDYSVLIPDTGVSCKLILDCTVPFRLKERFKRAEFLEVDHTKWLEK